MNTKGGAQAYEHPLVTFTNATREVNSGWYTWFRDKGTGANYGRHFYTHEADFTTNKPISF